MKKIFLKVVGYTLCGILIIVCILLIIAASVFGSKKTVDIFGFNVYLVDNDYIPTAPKGSAVLVQKGKASELEEGKLVLYLKPDAGDEPTLGYVKSISARDGVHYITVSYHDQPYEFPEGKLVGRADYSSTFWGWVLNFIKTPMGVMVLAVLPCAALILFDLARVAAANRPEPEVIPKVKNSEEETHSDIKLSVGTDGKALYSKDRSLKKLPKDNDVLFNYAGKQSSSSSAPRNSRPIIPLTDRKPQPAPSEPASSKTGKVFDIKLPSEDEAAAEPKPTAEPQTRFSTEVLPDSNELASAASRYSRSYKRLPKESVSENTSALSVTKKQGGNSFFAQSQSAPQIGKSAAQRPAAEGSGGEISPRPEKNAGKRSTQILASKSLDDIFSDDDDRTYARNMNDKAVDDILAGLNRRE